MAWIDIGIVGGLIGWYLTMIALAAVLAYRNVQRCEGGNNGGESHSP